MAFRDLFTAPKPLIACIHLMPLPGSPRYAGSMREVYDTALAEAAIFAQYPIDGLIVENFRDAPFYPHALPAESIAALTAVTRDVLPGMNAGASPYAVPSPIEGSGTA